MKKWIFIILGIGLIAFTIYAYDRYCALYAPVVPQGLSNYDLFIPTGCSMQALLDKLEDKDFIEDREKFDWVAQKLKLKDGHIPSGRYVMQPGWSNFEIVDKIRKAEQVPVKLLVQSARTPEDLAGIFARQLEIDSATALRAMYNDSLWVSRDLNDETLLSLFIPNTYEFYWNVSPGNLISRMVEEYERFWESDGRWEKAQKMGLTPAQVYTLASIVEKESYRNEEKPTIAGVYLNRLERNIPLQADPTVIYAHRNFKIRRVLKKHLEIESPYNTYKNRGLPPGPIYMPSISSIDAVLNPEEHDYIFFVARPDGSGLHTFSETYAEHRRKANKFHSYLNSRGIR